MFIYFISKFLCGNIEKKKRLLYKERAVEFGVVDANGCRCPLDYVHLPLIPVTALEITVRLKGKAKEGDAFYQITELVASVANELDLFKAKDGDKVRNELRIVEADFLQYVDGFR